MDKNQSFCEICKIKVQGSFFQKHLSSERHLRAKAAKMFYKAKSNGKNPYKKQKIDERVIESLSNGRNSAAVQEFTTTNNRIKGVWVLMKDISTGRAFFKNRLSGKVQNQKPIGLQDEDIEEETFESVVVNDYEKVVYNDGEEYEEHNIGEWKDTSNSYWFGGEDVESNEKKSEKDTSEVDSHKSDIEDSIFIGKSSPVPRNEDISFFPKAEKINPEFSTVIEKTEYLKQQLEFNDIETEILPKPIIAKTATSSLFQKRSTKAKSNILNL
jgi:hypothetical protein